MGRQTREHFWVIDIERKDEKVYGTINNDPNIVKSVKLGQRVEVPNDRISDWLYMRNGKMVGNFTLREKNASRRSCEAANHGSSALIRVEQEWSHARLVRMSGDQCSEMPNEEIQRRGRAAIGQLPAREWAMFQWPGDYVEVQRFVIIDFAAILDALATQSPEEFDAV